MPAIPRAALLLAALAVATTCVKDTDRAKGEPRAGAGDQAKGEPKASAGDHAEGPTAPIGLAKLGLQVDAPAGAEVADTGRDITISGGAIDAMTVGPAGATIAKTADEAKAGLGDYLPINVETEVLPDGWALTFEGPSRGQAPTYWVMSRREIGGKVYACGTTAASSAAQQAAILAACKSLRPRPTASSTR